MARLVRRQRLSVHVGYHVFGLQDSDDGGLPVPFPDGVDVNAFLGVHPGRLDITSGGHTHHATVDVEVWDGAPPQDAVDWDEQGEATVESSSGELAVWSLLSGRMDGAVVLGGSGGSWRVRVGCVGRAAAAALSAGTGTGTGVERYLLRFWPCR